MGAPTKAESTVWGATRAYRRDCLPTSMALEPCMGWDGLDEIRVQLRGCARRRSSTCRSATTARGRRELTSLHQGEALGRASWYMGYRPTYLALRLLYRARREPAALGDAGATRARRRGARRRLPDPIA